MSTMRISQLAERSGVPATTLRYYESAGLLAADRTPSGYRTYGEDAVTRLAFIGSAKHLGLPLDEIGELLTVWESGACADVKADLRPRVAARLTESERRLTEMEAFTRSLHDVLHRLDALPDRTVPCDAECGFPDGPPRAEQHADTTEQAGCGCGSAPGLEKAEEQAIFCSLSGDGMAERVAEWRTLVDGARPEGIDGGVRVTMPAAKAGAVAELAAAEQRCCPFFDFRLCFDGDVVHLEVRAPADAAGLIDDLFAP
ncbi:MerR family transcriptional regulator [Actinomadura bangladeshensis]|uniref:MerR family transcriptional regulator n=1 Tax=Actinomadura bangladeshensis TaxID=453573 RepID=A0A6L9QR43_9ACTN|nr:MerR family transcriptional regulator [Actinomadura bangladeshensis]NEA27950.1 MerR family transcriptional regulator [Actinomadura bangladeshensis]